MKRTNPRTARFSALVAAHFLTIAFSARAKDVDWSSWTPLPESFKGAIVSDGKLTLQSGKWRDSQTDAGRWAFSAGREKYTDVKVELSATILEPAEEFGFFGDNWSVWPGRTSGVNDKGFDFALVLRADEHAAAPGHLQGSAYRVQFSAKYQCVALMKYPDGGYVRVVPCALRPGKPFRVAAEVTGNQVNVRVDGKERIRFTDVERPLQGAGRVGLGVSSSAVVQVRECSLTPLPPTALVKGEAHTPNFSARQWLGGRHWVFDGDEPILFVPSAKRHFNNVKLRPGFKPLLSWQEYWNHYLESGFDEVVCRPPEYAFSGGGNSLKIDWLAKAKNGRFVNRNTMNIGWNSTRQVYTYDIDSQLEILPGAPFVSRYGHYFEHHAVLDPFNWQYQIVRCKGGKLRYRPVQASYDPGPIHDVEGMNGLRLWRGRHIDDFHIAPAVEYVYGPTMSGGNAKGEEKLSPLSSTICAAFYDNSVGFESRSLAPGTKIYVRFRYTGYPRAEAEQLFAEAVPYQANQFAIVPEQVFLFASTWPKIRFDHFSSMAQAWPWGSRPFLSGHGDRLGYELERSTNVGSGFAIKLPCKGYAAATLPLPGPLAQGRYLITALAKSDHVAGPGGFLEVASAASFDTNGFVFQSKPATIERHYVGNGSFDWKPVGFVTEVPSGAKALAIAFGNAGTGHVLFAEWEIQRLEEEAPLPRGTAARAISEPPFAEQELPPANVIADYRMEEGAGHDVWNSAGKQSRFPQLELSNLTWVEDQGHKALQFADNLQHRRDYRRGSQLHLIYFASHDFPGGATVPVAIAGRHGGDFRMPEISLAALIKPSDAMGQSSHNRGGDIVGVGGRRFILGLVGMKPPYKLSGRLNAEDEFLTEKAAVDANHWQHVAMTCREENGKWRVTLYHNGKEVGDGVSKKFSAPANIPVGLVMGSEVYYLHDAYYRGLIGRTLIFDRALSADEVAHLARQALK